MIVKIFAAFGHDIKKRRGKVRQKKKETNREREEKVCISEEK